MKIISFTDDSFGTGERIYYTVEIQENVFCDVMNIKDGAIYVMETGEGGNCYCDSEVVGSVEDYGVTENAIINFVVDSLEEKESKRKDTSMNSYKVLCTITLESERVKAFCEEDAKRELSEKYGYPVDAFEIWDDATLPFRNVKITAGMGSDYEVIRTEAPKDLIERQLTLNNTREAEGITGFDAYDIIKQQGYSISLVASSESTILAFECPVDEMYDYYDYEPTEFDMGRED